MKIILRTSFAVFFFLLTTGIYAQKQYTLQSPDGKLQATIDISKTNIEYSINHGGDLILDKSPISMKLTNGNSFGIDPKLSGTKKRSVDEIIESPVYKKSQVRDNYNELLFKFKGNYNLIFRAYNEGIAYRFVSELKEPFIVENEEVNFNFPSNNKAFIPYVRGEFDSFEPQFRNPFENVYTYSNLSEWKDKHLAFLPILIESVNGKKVCITESDLLDYPGMYLYKGDKSNTLSSVYAPYPKVVKQGAYKNLMGIVEEREPYIAKCEGQTNFPWRIIIVSENDAQLANNDMVYKLSTPTFVEDISWIKPGKAAWDWWSGWNLYDVDFKTGINNETYRYFIDFASKYGIEYLIFDDGWSVDNEADLFKIVPHLDLEGLVKYANSKNVGVILWAGYYAFDRDMEKACKYFSEMGVKGFKVDYMDRDDQLMVDFHHRAARTAAKYKLLIDFHGTYKPTGLQRTYPNVVSFEGVHGMEQMKWISPEIDQVQYDVTIPFIRMIAGPMDYTQGAMRNATRENYRSIHQAGMSQGTRCRQIAEYIVFEAPLSMMCDSPSDYIREEECTEFITGIPTVWDNTIVLNGEVAKYVTIARQKGDKWYVGSMTNWDARTLTLDLSFLGEGEFKAEIFKDGVNAHRVAKDYKKEIIEIPANKKLDIYMAPGGAYAMKIERK